MRIIPGNAQHLGSRKEQQDDFGFSDLDDVTFVNRAGVLAVVTDGMGGLERGREASLIAKQTMLHEYEDKAINKAIPQALIGGLSVANAKVVELAEQAGLEGQIGTTMVVAAIKDKELYWASVGDSRIYLYRRGKLSQLSSDHDYARELSREVALGRISPEEAANHPQRQALTSYLGLPSLHEIDRNEDPIMLEPGDRVLLCSDGLYKTVPEEEIVGFLDQDPQHAAEELIAATLVREKKNQDNVTVAILACESNLEVNLFRSAINFVKLYATSLIIILVILIGLGSVSFLAAQYYYSTKDRAKDAASESQGFTPPAVARPPLVGDEPVITPTVRETKQDAVSKMVEKGRPEVRNKKIQKGRAQRGAETRTY